MVSVKLAADSKIRRFREGESGAISVDWVVLTAGVMALGLLFVNIVKTGQDEIGSSLGGSLSSSATTIPEIDF